MAEILIDTSAAYALLAAEDAHHAKAVEIYGSIQARNIPLVLSNFILAETHTIINRRIGHAAAREFLNNALRDFEIERATLEDEWAAHAILQGTTRSKDLSYFDAVTLAVAERLGIKEIFSFDSHFEMMGLALSVP